MCCCFRAPPKTPKYHPFKPPPSACGRSSPLSPSFRALRRQKWRKDGESEASQSGCQPQLNSYSKPKWASESVFIAWPEESQTAQKIDSARSPNSMHERFQAITFGWHVQYYGNTTTQRNIGSVSVSCIDYGCFESLATTLLCAVASVATFQHYNNISQVLLCFSTRP